MYSTMSKEAWPDWKAEEGQNAEEVRLEPSREERRAGSPPVQGRATACCFMARLEVGLLTFLPIVYFPPTDY